MRLHSKWVALTAALEKEKKILVAFSGGCDSSLLLAAARRILDKRNILAVTAVSASLAVREKKSAETIVRLLDVDHLWLETDELNNPSYTANPSNRCFFCKNELFGKLAPLAKERGMTVLDGFNASDRSDIRPGLQAARTWNVKHPLDEANLVKPEIRVLSRWLRLPTWNKPASPCLSSRIPYGMPVTVDVLRRVEQAESFLHREGFPIVRVRHYGPRARIEVPLPDLPRLQEPGRWARIVASFRQAGYQEVEMDPRGHQSGRLNALSDAHAFENSSKFL